MSKVKAANSSSVVSIWKSAINLIVSKPQVLIPFALLAAVETIVLYLLSCAPHFPVNIVLAPPIRSIWGGIFLHYPFIYELLPKMFYWAKIVIGILVGPITTAMAILYIYSLVSKKTPNLKNTFLSSLKSYISIFLLALLVYLSAHFIVKYPPILIIKYFRAGHTKLLFLGPGVWLKVIVPLVRFVITLLLQCLFVYSFPFVVLKGKKFIPAFLSGIKLFIKLFVSTLALAGLPMVLYIPNILLRSNLGFLSDKFSPEVTVGVLFFGIIMGTMIVDLIITISTTILFLEVADEKK